MILLTLSKTSFKCRKIATVTVLYDNSALKSFVSDGLTRRSVYNCPYDDLPQQVKNDLLFGSSFTTVIAHFIDPSLIVTLVAGRTTGKGSVPYPVHFVKSQPKNEKLIGRTFSTFAAAFNEIKKS